MLENRIYKTKGIGKFVSKLWTITKEILTDNLVINACIFEDYGKVLHRNWGDDINYFFLKKLFRKEIIVYDYSSLSFRFKKENYLVIGSTITLLTNSETIVWGAGIIDPTSNLPQKPKKVLAVRGPLTRDYLLQKGVECPEVYGDPALLLPFFYEPSIKKKYKIGFIPHYQDSFNTEANRLCNDSNVLLIKIEGYKNWEDFVDQINSCEMIASSSLHGLIVATAYGIPNLWIELDGNLLGGHFKFHDFFLSIGKDRDKPYLVTGDTKVVDLVNNMKLDNSKLDLKKLINSSPIKIEIK